MRFILVYKSNKPIRTSPSLYHHIHIFIITTNGQLFDPLADARSCVTCDKVLAELEKIDDDTDSFGVDFVKINDKRLAKQYGIKTFPALTYFR